MRIPFNPERVYLRENIRTLAPFITGKVLDIGSGTFLRYKNLFKYAEYVTMDRSHADILGSVESIPAADASFDSIVCTQVLGDVFELRKAFSEMYRILKGGGYILISEAFFGGLHDEPHDYWRFTPYSLKRLSEEAGFTVKKLLPVGGIESAKIALSLIEKKSYGQTRWLLHNIISRLKLLLSKDDTSIMTIGHVILLQKSLLITH